MASVYRVGSVELRRHASGMSPKLIDRLSQPELNARVREMERLRRVAGSLPADLARERLERARQIRDAMPYPDYQAALERLTAARDALPGTGGDAIDMRGSLSASISGLRERNTYPAGLEQELRQERVI